MLHSQRVLIYEPDDTITTLLEEIIRDRFPEASSKRVPIDKLQAELGANYYLAILAKTTGDGGVIVDIINKVRGLGNRTPFIILYDCLNPGERDEVLRHRENYIAQRNGHARREVTNILNICHQK